MNRNFSLRSKLSLDTKTSQCFITENAKKNLFNLKYYLTKGILQFTVFFDHPVFKAQPLFVNFFWKLFCPTNQTFPGNSSKDIGSQTRSPGCGTDHVCVLYFVPFMCYILAAKYYCDTVYCSTRESLDLVSPPLTAAISDSPDNI